MVGLGNTCLQPLVFLIMSLCNEYSSGSSPKQQCHPGILLTRHANTTVAGRMQAHCMLRSDLSSCTEKVTGL
ncbi:hypothetical protein KC327_g57 [Hortaea werneckii]|nr:hypothetical protein KC327_g57 [Hortaea werneckii]